LTVKERRVKTQSKNYRRQVRGQYTYGNTVRKADTAASRRSNIRTYEGGNIKRNNEKRSVMNAGYVLFLAVMMCVVGFFCMRYLSLTSSITNDLSEIAKLEADLNNLKAENDDHENRINGAIALEYIKKKAMNDLGMKYASDDQIVKYESDDTDYVRQYIMIEE